MFTRIIKTLLGVAALFMLTAASLHADTTVTTTENGEFVAKVNGSAILRKEFDWSLVSAEKQFASIGNQPGAGQVNLKKEVPPQGGKGRPSMWNAGGRAHRGEDLEPVPDKERLLFRA